MKTTVVKVLDDTTGEDITDSYETVEFSLDGKDYEIDLTPEGAEELREQLALWVASARKAASRPVAKASSTPKGKRDETQAARAWLLANGWKPKDKGRIPAEMWEAYRQGLKAEAARPDSVIRAVPDPEELSEDQPAPTAEDVTDDMVIRWHEAKGYKVTTSKDGRPNGLMRNRFLKAHGLAS